MSRSRNYCFTINNFTAEDTETLENVECDYIIYGVEQGEEAHTPHYQGYIEFGSARTFKSVSKLLGGRCHLEPRRGTASEAATYCKKAGDFKERGVMKQQGHRTDLDGAIKLVQDCKSLQQIAEEFPKEVVLFSKGLEKLHNLLLTDRKGPPNVTWLWGETGVGKSRWATDCESFYMKDRSKWWDGYDQQKRIIFDDFNGWDDFQDLLKILDRYPYSGQTKGSYVRINSPEIFITSYYAPNHYYDGDDLKQLMRRVTAVVNLCAECTEVPKGNSEPWVMTNKGDSSSS
nr:MAG: replication associated protein [Cressdnaviricota sp.]